MAKGIATTTVDALLSEIRRLAANQFSAERLAEVDQELRAHLDASIQARLELGLETQQAEREAVAAFGDPKAFIRELAGVHLRGAHTFDPGFTKVWFISIGLLFLFVICLEIWHLQWSAVASVMQLAWLTVGALTAYLSWRLARFQLPSMAYAIVLGAVLMSLVQTPFRASVNFGDASPLTLAVSMPWRKGQLLADVKESTDEIARLRQEQAHFKTSFEQFKLASKAGMDTFVYPAPNKSKTKMLLRETTSQKVAADAWTQLGPGLDRLYEAQIRAEEAQAAALASAYNRPFWLNFMMLLVPSAFISLTIVAPITLLHVLGVLLAKIKNIIRRRSGGLTA